MTGLMTLSFVGKAQFPGMHGQKLIQAEQAISRYYVDTVNEKRLVEDAIRGMLEQLDPHSSYTNPEETRELIEPLNGNFSGIGISFNMNQDTLFVIQTVAGGPSERVGMLAGDRIIAVNDSTVAGVKMKNSDIMKRLRGKKGTDVNVTVLRKSVAANDTIDFRITRDDIPIYSVDASYMVNPTTGYIRISRFAAETPKETREALAVLKKNGMKNLILDLVDNGGGYLNAATSILGEFLAPGSLAVFTEGRSSSRKNFEANPSHKKPMFADGRIVVMVNQYSASASEITAGAIQDWDRGLIVGRRTFGKGLVQTPVPFSDGSMMRLTTAHYYTPSGRDIQKPYTKGDQKSYQSDIIDRLNSGELMHSDSIRFIDSLRVETLRNRRPIYGGGGISPDRFVALDTTMFTRYYRDIVAKGLINRYVISYVDKNRKQLLHDYPDDNAFVKGFKVTDDMLGSIFSMAEQEGIAPQSEQAAISRPLFELNIKGLIGRDTYENSTFFKVYNLFDPIFTEALRLINSDDYDELLKNGRKV